MWIGGCRSSHSNDDYALLIRPAALHQVRRRLRRQRPCRSAPQRAGRARLHRQSAQDERLAARRAVWRGHGEFRGDAGVEQGGGVSQDDCAVRGEVGGEVGLAGLDRGAE